MNLEKQIREIIDELWEDCADLNRLDVRMMVHNFKELMIKQKNKAINKILQLLKSQGKEKG